MVLATSPTRERFPISTKKIIKKTITGSILWIVVFVFIYLFFSIYFNSILQRTYAYSDFSNYFSAFTIVSPIILVFVILMTILYQKWYYQVYYYDLGRDFIVIRKGPVTPHEITIPYERVQDVYVDQDILDRIIGLYDVHLSSATVSSGYSAHVDGLEKPAAEGLRDELLRAVSTRISRNRVNNIHTHYNGKDNHR